MMSKSIAAAALSALSLSVAACATSKPAAPARAAEPLVHEPDGPPPEPTPPPFSCADEDIDWPMFQRTEGRVGATDAPAIETPTVAWSRPIGIAGWLDNPLIADGRVYAPSSGQVWNRPDGADGLYAFDLKTGDPLWFVATADDANGAAYSKCRVFVGSDAGTVTAVDARNGDVLWVSEFQGKMYANPLPLDDVVIVAGAQGSVAALDVETGAVVWRREVGAAVRGGAAADARRVFVTTEAARVVALDRHTGAPVWSAQIQAPGIMSAYSTPTVAAGKVYVGFVRDTYYDVPAVHVYDAATGQPGWDPKNTHDLGGGWGNIRSSPALHDGRLYWGEAYSNRIVGLDITGGDVSSSVPAGFCMFPQWPSPAIAQEVVYVPRHDGGLYAYDLEHATLRWSLYVGEANSLSQSFPPELQERDADRCDWDPPFGRPVYASPAIAADGTLVVATGDGWLHAIRNGGQ